MARVAMPVRVAGMARISGMVRVAGRACGRWAVVSMAVVRMVVPMGAVVVIVVLVHAFVLLFRRGGLSGELSPASAMMHPAFP